MPPRSILKKRAQPEPDSDVEEVPRTAVAGPADPKTFEGEDEASDSDEDEDDSDEDSYGSDDEGELDTDDDDEDDILAMGDQPPAAKKLKHTTLRPTPAPNFSLALNHLLSLPPSKSSLAPKNAPPSAQTQRLERRAKSLIRETKASHLARGHVRDVIAGWGARPQLAFSLWDSKSALSFEKAQRGAAEQAVAEETGAEREKRLRRLAQRGVVRLFNAIAAAQGAPEKEESKKRKLDDEASEAGTDAVAPVNKILRQPNVLGGRGKGEALSNLSKASFLDLIRAGTTTSTR